MIKRSFLALLAVLPLTCVAAGTASVETLISNANQAADAGDKSTLGQIDKQITAVRSTLPDWVGADLAKASRVADSQAGAVKTIREMTGDARSDLAKGDLKGAISDQESALFIANETFGDDHWLTISANRDLGYIYRQAGRAKQAETYYGKALAAATKVLGDRHPRTLEINALLAELYAAVGDYENALAMRKTVAEGLASSLGPYHAYTIDARTAKVHAEMSAGKYQDASTDAVDLCGAVERSWGRYHPEFMHCQELLGDVETTTGALSDAETTYKNLSVLMGKVIPGVDSEVLDNLSQLAEVYRRQGNYPESKQLLSGVIQLALQTGSTDESYVAKSYLGRVLSDEGDYPYAQRVTEEALDYGTKHWQDTPLQFYNTLLELGSIYQSRGKLPDAEATFEQAYKGLSASFGDDNPSTLVAINDLGQLYEKIGIYDKAEPLLKKALAKLVANFGEAHPDTLRARNNLALLYESQGNFREAEPLYLKSLALMKQVHGDNYTDTVAVENNLAYLYMLEERYDESVAMFEKVRAAWTGMFGKDHQNTLKATNNLARVYEKMGKYDQAEPLFDATLAARKAVLGEDHLDTIRSMIDLGGLYLDQNRLGEADKLLTDALARAERVLGNEHPYTFDALDLLTRTRQQEGNLQAAVDLARKGMSRRTDFLDRVLWATGENSREGYLRLARPELDEYLSLLAEVGGAQGGRDELEASLQRKGLLLKVTSEIQQIATLTKDPELRVKADRLDTARKRLAALTLSGPTAETRGHHAEALYALEQQVNELQGELGRASERYRNTIAKVDMNSLESALANNTALVDFMQYEDKGQSKMLAGIALNQDGKVTYRLVKFPDAGAINDAIVKYRTMIQDDLADESDINEAGRRANDLVWAPVDKVLDGVKVVDVVPDGMLNILPFNALVDSDNKYLIQTHDVRIMTSGRDLLPTRFKLAKGKYLIVAGPDYNSDDVVPQKEIQAAEGRRSTNLQLGIRGAGSGLRGLKFSPLPGAEREGRIITKQVESRHEPGVEYFGKKAQEAVLSDLTQPPEILHVATHGFFLKPDDTLRKRLLKVQRGVDEYVPPPGDNPLLRAGLAFAGVNRNAPYLGDIDTNNDGVLTALEVLGLDLSGTRLVVLSACETGLGEIHEGEGVYGLRRAFQQAGVAEVVSSLWEVSDAGTQALMADFYKRMLAGDSPRQALRHTQLGMLDSPQWGYPYIWSAFMIVGSYESAGFAVNQ
ncbi:MAG TPA: CHAT domain-containing tetratricopeptide repeat protein [Pseudomonadales bacterium]|nr:CHAT domain-containing tetratricopeptide repeat protein [Pseudomonadales bacterium]